MTRISYILLFILLASMNLCAQDWRTLYATANEAYNQSDSEQARLAIDQCIDTYLHEDGSATENYASILRLKANIEFYDGNYEPGLVASLKELEVRENKNDIAYAGALENTAEFQMALGQYEEALKSYEIAGRVLSQLLENSHQMFLINKLNQAVCLYFIGEIAKAVPLFENSLVPLGNEVTDSNALLRGHYNYALVCSDLEQYDKALLHFDWGKRFYELADLQQTQEYNDLLYNMAYADSKINKYNEAEQFYLLAQTFYEQNKLTNDPGYAHIVNGRTLNLQRMGEVTKANEVINSATSANSQDPFLLTNKAVLLQSNGDLSGAEKLYRQVLQLRNAEKNTITYAETQRNFASLLSENGQHQEALELMAVSMNTIRSQMNKGNVYLSSCINYGNILLNASKPGEAVPFYEEALRLCESPMQPEWAKSINGLSICQLRLGNLLKADSIVQLIFEKADTKALQSDIQLTSILNNQATIKQSMGQLNIAHNILKQAASITRNHFGINNIHYLSTLENLAILNLEIGDLQSARNEIDSVLLITKGLKGDQSDEYAAALIISGKIFQYQGEFIKAEPLFRKALDIARKNEGTTDHIRALNALGIFYQIMGNYEQAEPLFVLAQNNSEKNYGISHPEYATSTQNLATLYQFQGKYAEAERLLSQTLDIDRKLYGEMHPQYAISLQNLATVYIKLGQYDKSQPLLEKVLTIHEQTIGKLHPAYVVTLSNLASLYQDTRQPDKAEQAWKESVAIRKRILGEDHPDYARSLYGLAGIYFAKGQIEEAKDLYEVVIKKYLKQIHDNFPSMSEKEKGAFYSMIKPIVDTYQDFCVEYYYRHLKSDNAAAILGQLYDLQLSTKAILLNSTNKVRELILTSQDKGLVEDFEKWIRSKEEIIKFYSLGLEERQLQGVQIQRLEEETNQLEKELSTRSELFKSQFDLQVITHKDVIAALQPDEVAIEIIRLKKKLIRDSVSYIGLILTKESVNPQLVVWPLGNKLEKRNYQYFRNAIKFQLKDTLSFKYFWTPLQKALVGKSQLFVSSDGIFNKINLATLYDPKGGLFVIDNLTLSLISNSNEIVLNRQNRIRLSSNSNAVLIGAVDFNNKSTAPSQVTKRSLAANYGFKSGNIPGLPATGIEVDRINAILSQKSWQPILLKKEKATEAQLKKIQSPRILHVATHGFFFSDMDFSESESQQELFSNPLLRSGILLAGAGVQTENNEMLSSDDGALTAYEAMNLYLDGTELVVLSACETGLGEVRNGEGVYGLQRSFIVAGSKAVMMSLWQVDDVATQELMVAFYENWINGDQKLEAFRKAQLSLKKKYKEPYFWGAFVMIGS